MVRQALVEGIKNRLTPIKQRVFAQLLEDNGIRVIEPEDL